MAKPTIDPVLRLQPQRAGGDCGISCLSSITGLSYEDVLVEAAGENIRPHENGLYLNAMIRIAGRLGYPLRKKRVCNFFFDKGILDVTLKHRKTHDHHVVILMGGLIFDMSDATVWTPTAFKSRWKAEFGSILVPS